MIINGYFINDKTGVIEGYPSRKYKLKEVDKYKEIIVESIKLLKQKNLNTISYL
ncbi:hypothetical protein LCGC14_1684270 [marine sediment metagenome]|uniref:Uncharacterized protein n=1 Tax=marine sediment metagenome TaxID=412755 RepID=A0A0F9IA72_9ZZZZ